MFHRSSKNGGVNSAVDSGRRHPRFKHLCLRLQYGGAGARLLGMASSGGMRIDTSDAILAETIGVLRDKFGWDGYRLLFAREELRKLANVGDRSTS